MVPGKMAYICKVLQNDGILLQQYMVSQHRRPQFERRQTFYFMMSGAVQY